MSDKPAKEGIVCLECGRTYRHVGRHVLAHDMNADEYRAKWGLHAREALCVASVSEERRRIAERSGGPERLRAFGRKYVISTERRVGERVSPSESMLAAKAAERRQRREALDDRAREHGYSDAVDWLRSLRADGLTNTECARVMGVSVYALGRLARDGGLPKRRSGPRRIDV